MGGWEGGEDGGRGVVVIGVEGLGGRVVLVEVRPRMASTRA